MVEEQLGEGRWRHILLLACLLSIPQEASPFSLGSPLLASSMYRSWSCAVHYRRVAVSSRTQLEMCSNTCSATGWSAAQSLAKLGDFFAGKPMDVEEREVEGLIFRTLDYYDLTPGGNGKLQEVARLCTRGMFGSEVGALWVYQSFVAKYAPDSGRKSVIIVAEKPDQTIVGCVGMELMLLSERGMSWWNDPSSVTKLRPYLSDLVVDSDFQRIGLGRQLLLSCEKFVQNEWAEEVDAMKPLERLDYSLDKIYLKVSDSIWRPCLTEQNPLQVSSDNTKAMNLYKSMGYRETARAPEELLIPTNDHYIEWPVLNLYLCKPL
eukprot:767320-Hanusia_phi.AAC.19